MNMPKVDRRTHFLVVALLCSLSASAADQSDAEESLKKAVEMMRSQGMTEVQIEEFRRMTQGVINTADSNEDNSKDAFEQQYGSAPDVFVILGDREFTLKRTECHSNVNKFLIMASDGSHEGAAKFRMSRTKFAGNTYASQLSFEVDGTFAELDPVPWNYDSSEFSYDGDVDAYGVDGSTGRVRLRLTVRAPCS